MNNNENIKTIDLDAIRWALKDRALIEVSVLGMPILAYVESSDVSYIKGETQIIKASFTFVEFKELK